MTMLEIDEVIEIHKMLIDVTGGSHGIRDIKRGYKELDFKTFIIG